MEYERRRESFGNSQQMLHTAMLIAELQADVDFLKAGHVAAAQHYSKALATKSSSTEKLKEAAWDSHEYQELLQQAQHFLGLLEDSSDTCDVKAHQEDFRGYLRNLFKKKRTAASHVLVIMVAEEKRSMKPYALPVQYIPYRSIRDQEIRDVLAGVKRVMSDMGMTVVGKLQLHR